MLRLVLNIARIVVDPRQGNAFAAGVFRIPRIGWSNAGLVGCCRSAEVKFVDIDLVESLVKVLFAPALQKLSLDLGFGDFGYCDGTELVEALVAYLAVKDNFLRGDIDPVDVSEDVNILRETGKVIVSV